MDRPRIPERRTGQADFEPVSQDPVENEKDRRVLEQKRIIKFRTLREVFHRVLNFVDKEAPFRRTFP
jgi:hypothetical protein